MDDGGLVRGADGFASRLLLSQQFDQPPSGMTLPGGAKVAVSQGKADDSLVDDLWGAGTVLLEQSPWMHALGHGMSKWDSSNGIAASYAGLPCQMDATLTLPELQSMLSSSSTGSGCADECQELQAYRAVEPRLPVRRAGLQNQTQLQQRQQQQQVQRQPRQEAVAPPPRDRYAAQKRFRLKQRDKVQALQYEANKMQAEARRLSDENEELKHKSEVLQSVLASRDEHVHILSQVAAQETEGTHHTVGGTAAYLNKPALGLLFSTSVSAVQAQEQLEAASTEGLKQIWRDFVHQVSAPLVQAGLLAARSTGGEMRTVLRLVSDISVAFRQAALFNPMALYQLKALNLDTGEAAAPRDEHWANVVAAMEMTEDQRRSIKACFGLFERALSKVLRDREALCAQLRRAEAVLSAGTAGQLDPSPDLQLDIRSIAEGLHNNLRREHVARTMFASYVSRKVLTPLQFAKGAVHAYPYFPDSTAMALAVCAGPNLSLRHSLTQHVPQHSVIETAPHEAFHSSRLVETGLSFGHC